MVLLPRSTYYDRDYRQSAALIRARKPFLIKNTIAGLGLFGVVIGIYSFTIRAVSQDEFEDVKVPAQPSPKSGSSNISKGPSVG